MAILVPFKATYEALGKSLVWVSDLQFFWQVESLTGLEDLNPGYEPFNVVKGEDVFFPAPLWETTSDTTATTPGDVTHALPAQVKMIMPDDTQITAKAILLVPSDRTVALLPAGVHLVNIDFVNIRCVKPVQVILRPASEKVSLRFERAHCSKEIWESTQTCMFPPAAN